MQRLSALDAEFLHLEDGISHMHIAGMSVFDGAPPTEDEVRALLVSKLHLIPRYRQRVRSVPLELGRPVWVDDPHFNLAYHVRETALVEPTDEALCRLMGRLMSQELDRNRPLWEAWIVRGLPEGQWALVSKVHHCMVDGISGVGLLQALLDAAPDVELAEAQPWTPSAEPSDATLVLDAWGGLLGDVGARIGRLSGWLRDPLDAARTFARTTEGVVRFGRGLTFTPPVSLDGTIGPHRVWAHSSASIDDVRRVRKSFGGTLNDVVLAAATNGYRNLLLSRGDHVDAAVVRTLVPVSSHAADTAGNRVSAMVYELPVDIADPVERLDAVKAQMSALKGSHMIEAADLVTSVADLVPPMFMGNATRLVRRLSQDRPQRSLDTVTTNVPGPQLPLYCRGRRMTEHRPFVPIWHGLRVGTAILSYDGRLFFGVTGDYDSSPDVEVVAEGISAGIEDLLARAR